MKLRKTKIAGAVNSLLDTISDKDDGVKKAVERSLVRMCKRRPNETIEILYNYRQKCLKLTEAQVALLLRYYTTSFEIAWIVLFILRVYIYVAYGIRYDEHFLLFPQGDR